MLLKKVSNMVHRSASIHVGHSHPTGLCRSRQVSNSAQLRVMGLWHAIRDTGYEIFEQNQNGLYMFIQHNVEESSLHGEKYAASFSVLLGL